MGSYLKLTASALLGVAAFAACLVPDVELVESLPGAGASSAGSSLGGTSAAGSSSDAGETSSRSGMGGEPSGGDGGSTGDAGGDGGGTGGAAGTSGAGTGGSAGTSGSGTSGSGNVTGGPFNPTSICDVVDSSTFCEPFLASGPVEEWQDVTSLNIEETEQSDAPSPYSVLTTGYLPRHPSTSLPDGAKVSFWVRFSQQTDQYLVSFGGVGIQPVSFGIEGDRYRFRYGFTQDGVVAPSAANKSVTALKGEWACVEIALSEQTIEARVVPFGKSPVTLPPIDSDATAGEDDNWNTVVTGPYNWDGTWWFGYEGNDVDIDEVLVSAWDATSVCDHYLAAAE